jgi:hypothetical protein
VSEQKPGSATVLVEGTEEKSGIGRFLDIIDNTIARLRKNETFNNQFDNLVDTYYQKYQLSDQSIVKDSDITQKIITATELLVEGQPVVYAAYAKEYRNRTKQTESSVEAS